MFLLMLLKALSSMLTCVPLVLIREHFPTKIRGFCFHLAYMVGRVTVILALSTTQFTFDLSPRLLLSVNQIAVLLSIVTQCYLKVETFNVPIE